MKAKSIGMFITSILLVILLVFLAPLFSAAIGYVVGLFLAWAGGGLLTGILGITTANLPKIIAWLFLVMSLLVTRVQALK